MKLQANEPTGRRDWVIWADGERGRCDKDKSCFSSVVDNGTHDETRFEHLAGRSEELWRKHVEGESKTMGPAEWYKLPQGGTRGYSRIRGLPLLKR